MKTLNRFGLIAAFIIALASCVKEMPAPQEQTGTHTITFTAQKEIDTKTSVVEEGDVARYYWTEGDEQYFHIYENGIAATAVSMELSTDNRIARFTATFNDTEATEFSYTAVYGSSVSNARNPLVPNNQSPRLASFDPAADIMVSTEPITLPNSAEADNSTEFLFTLHRVVSVNKMTLKGLAEGETIKTVVLASSDGYFCSRYMGGDDNPYDHVGKVLTFDFTNLANATVGSDKTFSVYFTSAPVTEASFSVNVVTDQHVYYRDNFTSTLTFEVGKFRRFGIKLSEYSRPISTGVNYELVTSQNQLTSGDEYLIVGGSTFAMGSQKNNNRNAVAVTDIDGVITINNTIEACPVVITSTSNGYLIQDVSSRQYLYPSSKSNNYLKSRDDIGTDNYTVWVINVTNSVASIVNFGNTDRGIMGFNPSNDAPLFAAYGTIPNGSTANLALYKKNDTRNDVTLSFGTASYNLSIGTQDYLDFSGQSVTVTPFGVTGVKYTLAGAVIGSIDEDSGTLTLDGHTTGTATITASFTGNETFKPATPVSYTIVVDDPSVVDYVTLPWTYPEGDAAATSAGINAIAGVTTFSLGSDYAESHSPYRIKFDGTGDYILVKTDSAIGSVSVSFKKIGGAENSTLNILESSDNEDFTVVEDLSITGAKDATGTVTTSIAFNPASRYVKIYFTKVSNVGIGGISITKFDNTPRFTVDSPLSATADADDYTVNITRTNFTGAITVSVPSGCDWITAGNVAANANTLSIHVAANTGSARSAILTLSGTDVTSQELVVNQASNEPGTETNPFSVSQALAYIETLGDSSSPMVWVSGIVSNVDSYFSSYNSITYFISEDGTTSNQLEVYSGKGLNGANFSAKTDLAVGDVVTVKGYLKKFDNTPEFASNSQITSITYVTRYTVSTGSTSNGSLSLSATSVAAGAEVTVTTAPNSGYQLETLIVDGTDVAASVSNNQYSFTMPAHNVTVTATFSPRSSTVLWSETWQGGTAGEMPSEYGFEGTTVYNNGTVTYTNGGSATKLYDDTMATTNLLLAKSANSGTWTISGIPTAGETNLILSFQTNNNTRTRYAISTTTSGVTLGTLTVSGSSSPYTVTASITITGTVSSFNLTFTNGTKDNVRLDNLSIVVNN